MKRDMVQGQPRVRIHSWRCGPCTTIVPLARFGRGSWDRPRDLANGSGRDLVAGTACYQSILRSRIQHRCWCQA